MQNHLLKVMLMGGLIPFYAVNAQHGGNPFGDKPHEDVHLPKTPRLTPLNLPDLLELTELNIGPTADNSFHLNPSGFGGNLPASQVFNLPTEGSTGGTKYMSILRTLKNVMTRSR